MSNLIRSNKKLFVNSGGVLDPSIKPRIENLENNEYKILYFQTISSTTGTITKPTNSTILLDQFYSGGDAIVETLVNGQPSGQSPLTAGGSVVSVSSFDTSGNFTLSGTPSSYPVALIYIFTIKAVDYSNVVKANEMNMENNGLAPLASPTFTGVATFQNIIRLTSASLGTAVAGNIEFLTDKFYGVITTGTSRKEFVLADTALTSGRLLFTTTNGRVVDSGNLTYNGTFVNINTTAPINPTVGLHINTAAAGRHISLSSSISTAYQYMSFDENNSDRVANFIRYNTGAFPGQSYPGTSLAYAGSFSVINGAQSQYSLLMLGTPVIIASGQTGGNIGLRSDATGVRIGAMSTLHTSNTVSGLHLTTGNVQLNTVTPSFIRDLTIAKSNNGAVAMLLENQSTGASAFSVINMVAGSSSSSLSINGQNNTGNFLGTSIPIASTTYLLSGNSANMRTILAGSSTYILSGQTGTNVGLVAGATGIRIDTISALHNSLISGISLHINTGILRYSSRQIGNGGLSSGDIYVDTAANILANGDYVVGMKA